MPDGREQEWPYSSNCDRSLRAAQTDVHPSQRLDMTVCSNRLRCLLLLCHVTSCHVMSAGIMVIEHADFDGIERLALVLGGEIASTFDDPRPSQHMKTCSTCLGCLPAAAVAGIMSIEHADFDGIERLALVLGGEIASTFDDPKTAKLGHCKQIEEIMIGEDKLIHFSGDLSPRPQQMTILVGQCFCPVCPRI